MSEEVEAELLLFQTAFQWWSQLDKTEVSSDTGKWAQSQMTEDPKGEFQEEHARVGIPGGALKRGGNGETRERGLLYHKMRGKSCSGLVR